VERPSRSRASTSSSKTRPPDPGRVPSALTTGLKAGALADILVAEQLLGPLLPRAGGLPEPQAAALRIALGLQTCPDAPDPFLSRWPLSDPIPAAPILIAERTPT
jgi:hypothetical protein